MKKLRNLLADLKNERDNGTAGGVSQRLMSGVSKHMVTDLEPLIAKLEVIVEEELRVEKNRDGHIRGLERKIEALEQKLDSANTWIKHIRRKIYFCPRCDQPDCVDKNGQGCY